MKHIKKLFILTLLSLTTNAFADYNAFGETKFYAAIRGGYAWEQLNYLNRSFDFDGGCVHGALGLAFPIGQMGYDLDKTIYLRTEIESGWAQVNYNGQISEGGYTFDVDAEARAIPVAFNVLIDIPITNKFYAFAGIGLGYEFVDAYLDLNGSSGHESVEYWFGQARVGLGYWLAETIAIEAGYRIRTNDFRFDEKAITHMVETGIVFRF